MRLNKKILLLCILLTAGILLLHISAFAAELSEAEVERAVESQGKEAVTGNLFIWFLCAVAFLKVSQKIDSFLATLGVNVGNTGGRMMGELMIAGRVLANSLRPHGGSGGYQQGTSPGSTPAPANYLAGGLVGTVGRQVEHSAANAAADQTGHTSIGNALYRSSLNKGGDFANNVISNIAHGSYSQTGSIKGNDAEKAFVSYMGMQPTADAPLPSYSNIEIGGGRITGTESMDGEDRQFAMYSADQYMAPQQGTYDTVNAVDGTSWYRQYAQDAVAKKPYEMSDGKIAYDESIIKKLPPVPQRKDKI